MKRRLNILVAVPTSNHSERMKLEGILNYAHEKKGTRWNLELDLGGIVGRLSHNASANDYDGIIAYVRSDAERRDLLAIGLPLVLIEDLLRPSAFPRRADVVTLFCDHEAEGRTAARYFAGLGHRHFAFVGTDHDADYSLRREKGFRAELKARNARVHVPSPKDDLATWLRTLPKPCALFAVHDLRARQVLAAAEDAAIQVPSELAILGVDDDDVLCTTSSPTLSSIPTFDRSLGYAAGRALNEILLKRARGRVIRTRHTQVVTRHSTSAEAVSDIFVTKTLDWAKTHLDAKLTASVLARHAGCSKAYLQDRIERALGITLGAAIRRIRLTTAAELLVTTDLTVAEIAARCGFACLSHFAVLMRATYGLTPLAYRKRNLRLSGLT